VCITRFRRRCADGWLTYISVGYRVCDEIFTLAAHPLKLLLVNTLLNDLGSRREAIVQTALRNISSMRLVSAELVIAIGENIIRLFTTSQSCVYHFRRALLAIAMTSACTYHNITNRRLALAAALSLLRVRQNEAAELNPRLLAATRLFVLSSLFACHTSASSIPLGPNLLSALVSATSFQSILYPCTNDESQILASLVKIMAEASSGEWSAQVFQYHGVACPWLLSQVLERTREIIAVQSSSLET
jgi:hypothetical protein